MKYPLLNKSLGLGAQAAGIPLLPAPLLQGIGSYWEAHWDTERSRHLPEATQLVMGQQQGSASRTPADPS